MYLNIYECIFFHSLASQRKCYLLHTFAAPQLHRKIPPSPFQYIENCFILLQLHSILICDVLQFTQLFPYCWTFGLFPVFCFYKSCYSEKSCAYAFLVFESRSLEQIPTSRIAKSKGKCMQVCQLLPNPHLWELHPLAFPPAMSMFSPFGFLPKGVAK